MRIAAAALTHLRSAALGFGGGGSQVKFDAGLRTGFRKARFDQAMFDQGRGRFPGLVAGFLSLDLEFLDHALDLAQNHGLNVEVLIFVQQRSDGRTGFGVGSMGLGLMLVGSIVMLVGLILSAANPTGGLHGFQLGRGRRLHTGHRRTYDFHPAAFDLGNLNRAGGGRNGAMDGGVRQRILGRIVHRQVIFVDAFDLKLVLFVVLAR